MKGDLDMTTTEYAKPMMTNLPRELGSKIFDEIIHSPRADRNKMHEVSIQLVEEMKEERRKEKSDAAK